MESGIFLFRSIGNYSLEHRDLLLVTSYFIADAPLSPTNLVAE